MFIECKTPPYAMRFPAVLVVLVAVVLAAGCSGNIVPHTAVPEIAQASPTAPATAESRTPMG